MENYSGYILDATSATAFQAAMLSALLIPKFMSFKVRVCMYVLCWHNNKYRVDTPVVN